MDERLAKALAIVQERTGFGSFKKPAASAKRTEGQHTDKATPSAKPRSQKGRKYSAKQEAKRAAWRQKMGFKTRKEKLEVPTIAITASPAIPDEETGSHIPVPAPTPSPFQPVLAPDQKLTREQAQAGGYVMQKTWGVYQYRPKAGADWITCRVEGELGPAVMTVRRPLVSELYSRPQPMGLDRRCEHAKRGLPPDGTCTGNCDGLARFE